MLVYFLFFLSFFLSLLLSVCLQLLFALFFSSSSSFFFLFPPLLLRPGYVSNSGQRNQNKKKPTYISAPLRLLPLSPPACLFSTQHRLAGKERSDRYRRSFYSSILLKEPPTRTQMDHGLESIWGLRDFCLSFMHSFKQGVLWHTTHTTTTTSAQPNPKETSTAKRKKRGRRLPPLFLLQRSPHHRRRHRRRPRRLLSLSLSSPRLEHVPPTEARKSAKTKTKTNNNNKSLASSLPSSVAPKLSFAPEGARPAALFL